MINLELPEVERERAASQFLGPGDDTITLSGWITPDIAGDIVSIHELRTMGDKGEPYVMVSGTGVIYGLWEITTLDETQTLFYPNGTPRKIEFSLSLHRVDDEQIKQVGLISNIQELLR